jgi:hypothetical protein
MQIFKGVSWSLAFERWTLWILTSSLAFKRWTLRILSGVVKLVLRQF